MKKLILTVISVIILSFNAFATSQVVDEASYFSREEKSQLESEILALENEYGYDVTLLITKDTKGQSLEEYAEFHSSLDLDKDGIIFAIDIDAREYYTISRGILATNVISDQALDKIEEDVVPSLSENDFYGGYSTFVDLMDVFFKAYENGEAYSGDFPFVRLIIAVFIGTVISIIVASFVIAALKSQLNTAKHKETAADYVKVGSFKLNAKRDDFVSTHTSKTRIKSNSSSGSSGRSGASFKSGGRSGGRF